MSASTSTCTSAFPTLRPALCQLSTPTLCAKLFANFPAQCAPLDLNLGPSQLSVHRWTSTWDRSSSVCTAGSQPGICPAQCAPLDLNRGPAQLSVHCWTSTWDLPSSVCTAGPQRPDRICQKICQIECQKICGYGPPCARARGASPRRACGGPRARGPALVLGYRGRSSRQGFSPHGEAKMI